MKTMLNLVLASLSLCCIHAAAVGYGQQYQPYSPYTDYDDYYFLPTKPIVRYPVYSLPPYEAEAYRAAYSPYYYKPLPPIEEDPLRMEERAAREAALPVGQETWYESEPPTPRWRQAGLDDVNAAFLQNLIISQMARNAENRARALSPPQAAHEEQEDTDSYGERDTRDFEDEDVRELKALAGKPLYHSPKTEPRIAAPAPTNNYDYYDYPADDTFINWGNKRSATESPKTSTSAPSSVTASTTPAPSSAAGQREEVMLRPATPVRHPFPEPVMKMLQEEWRQEKRATSVYDKIKHMLASENGGSYKAADSRLKKRFVASEPDLVAELRGLKRRIVT